MHGVHVAVLQLLNKKEGKGLRFTRKDELSVKQLASFAAVVLENAASFEELNTAREAYGHIFDFAAKIKPEMSVDEILSNCKQKLLEIMEIEHCITYWCDDFKKELKIKPADEKSRFVRMGCGSKALMVRVCFVILLHLSLTLCSLKYYNRLMWLLV